MIMFASICYPHLALIDFCMHMHFPNKTMVLFGCSSRIPRRGFDRPLGVSNKVSLQNQLQNPCARNHDESNEVFGRVVRELLL